MERSLGKVIVYEMLKKLDIENFDHCGSLKHSWFFKTDLLQYVVNNLGTKLLFTCYWNVWRIPSNIM